MKKLLCAMTLLTLLGGCAVIHKPHTEQAGVANEKAWQQHQKQLEDFKTWSLQGRVASGKFLGWTGNLSWRQQADHFDVRLAGPLGAGGMRARGSLDHVSIKTDDGKHYETDDPDALVRQALGWSFPLSPLTWWARGMPAPGDYQRLSVDKQGLLRSLKQKGWTIVYQQYEKPAGAPAALPKRVILDDGDNRVRLVVDRWFDLQSKASDSH